MADNKTKRGGTRDVEELRRRISPAVSNLLWGRAAARCEFAGCNMPLWKSPVTQGEVNIAEKAHIWSFSKHGPRGRKGVPSAAVNSNANLLLVCRNCHKEIDADKSGERYSAECLQRMKADHERRVEIATGVGRDQHTHVLHYSANIGELSTLLSARLTHAAVFPNRYPAETTPIELGTQNSSVQDRDQAFWATEHLSLERSFNERVRAALSTRRIAHLSVFALAPQPLLMLLGTLLSDVGEVDVFAHHREPSGWAWPPAKTELSFMVEEPKADGIPALVLSVSGTITADRIQRALPAPSAIWTVRVPRPHNDCLKTRDELAQFRQVLRHVLDRVKARHGQETPIHIFPALPAAMAVELGRVRMPKADAPWSIYDQSNARGGFVHVMDIPKNKDGGLDDLQLT